MKMKDWDPLFELRVTEKVETRVDGIAEPVEEGQGLVAVEEPIEGRGIEL